MRSRHALAGVAFVVLVTALGWPAPAHGACSVYEVDVPYPHVESIFLARVVGPGSSPNRMEVEVLRVYLGFAPQRLDVQSDDCVTDLRDFIGHRVLFVRMNDPGYGRYLDRWVESRSGAMIAMGLGQPSLRHLLAYLGVAGLPPTATAAGDVEPPGRHAHLSILAAGATLLFALRIRLRTRST